MADEFDDDALTPLTTLAPDVALSQLERERMFGTITWTPASTPSNLEGISILGDWAPRNIVTVATPQLIHLGVSHVRFHRLAAKQLSGLLDAWKNAGLISTIITWDGSFVPRLKRGHAGSRNPKDLSNHSWGTAFDINARWNPLMATPPSRGQRGSVRDLVSLARQFGFFWGGDFHSRPDGMHFEICRLRP